MLAPTVRLDNLARVLAPTQVLRREMNMSLSLLFLYLVLYLVIMIGIMFGIFYLVLYFFKRHESTTNNRF